MLHQFKLGCCKHIQQTHAVSDNRVFLRYRIGVLDRFLRVRFYCELLSRPSIGENMLWMSQIILGFDINQNGPYPSPTSPLV